mmetsp:Transcript_540/g.1549  ORF Transcript_540/g.1549 Transcript_540/m.1549 type:complete len:265 (+) Transcript_540:352-1146(+)
MLQTLCGQACHEQHVIRQLLPAALLHRLADRVHRLSPQPHQRLGNRHTQLQEVPFVLYRSHMVEQPRKNALDAPQGGYHRCRAVCPRFVQQLHDAVRQIRPPVRPIVHGNLSENGLNLSRYPLVPFAHDQPKQPLPQLTLNQHHPLSLVAAPPPLLDVLLHQHTGHLTHRANGMLLVAAVCRRCRYDVLQGARVEGMESHLVGELVLCFLGGAVVCGAEEAVDGLQTLLQERGQLLGRRPGGRRCHFASRQPLTHQHTSPGPPG